MTRPLMYSMMVALTFSNSTMRSFIRWFSSSKSDTCWAWLCFFCRRLSRDLRDAKLFLTLLRSAPERLLLSVLQLDPARLVGRRCRLPAAVVTGAGMLGGPSLFQSEITSGSWSLSTCWSKQSPFRIKSDVDYKRRPFLPHRSSPAEGRIQSWQASWRHLRFRLPAGPNPKSTGHGRRIRRKQSRCLLDRWSWTNRANPSRALQRITLLLAMDAGHRMTEVSQRSEWSRHCHCPWY